MAYTRPMKAALQNVESRHCTISTNTAAVHSDLPVRMFKSSQASKGLLWSGAPFPSLRPHLLFSVSDFLAGNTKFDCAKREMVQMPGGIWSKPEGWWERSRGTCGTTPQKSLSPAAGDSKFNTMEYDPSVKSQFASRNQAQGLMWRKCGHATFENRTKSTAWQDTRPVRVLHASSHGDMGPP